MNSKLHFLSAPSSCLSSSGTELLLKRSVLRSSCLWKSLPQCPGEAAGTGLPSSLPPFLPSNTWLHPASQWALLMSKSVDKTTHSIATFYESLIFYEIKCSVLDYQALLCGHGAHISYAVWCGDCHRLVPTHCFHCFRRPGFLRDSRRARCRPKGQTPCLSPLCILAPRTVFSTR